MSGDDALPEPKTLLPGEPPREWSNSPRSQALSMINMLQRMQRGEKPSRATPISDAGEALFVAATRLSEGSQASGPHDDPKNSVSIETKEGLAHIDIRQTRMAVDRLYAQLIQPWARQFTAYVVNRNTGEIVDNHESEPHILSEDSDGELPRLLLRMLKEVTDERGLIDVAYELQKELSFGQDASVQLTDDLDLHVDMHYLRAVPPGKSIASYVKQTREDFLQLAAAAEVDLSDLELVPYKHNQSFGPQYIQCAPEVVHRLYEAMSMKPSLSDERGVRL